MSEGPVGRHASGAGPGAGDAGGHPAHEEPGVPVHGAPPDGHDATGGRAEVPGVLLQGGCGGLDRLRPARGAEGPCARAPPFRGCGRGRGSRAGGGERSAGV